MAALFYLPRLFVYHSTKEIGSDTSETFKVMESKLLKIIANPSLVLVWISGLALLSYKGLEIWLVLKMFLVMGMTLFHFYLNFIRVSFEADSNTKSEKFFRVINEIPTVLIIDYSRAGCLSTQILKFYNLSRLKDSKEFFR